MNKIPPFVILKSEDEYKEYFKRKYCQIPITTFDNIQVKFYMSKFADAFYESSNRLKRNKDIFSWKRAKRIDWIEYVLKNPEAELHYGWDRDKKIINKDRRVALITPENYVVIIRLNGNGTATYITSYYANNSADKIRNTPLWPTS